MSVSAVAHLGYIDLDQGHLPRLVKTGLPFSTRSAWNTFASNHLRPFSLNTWVNHALTDSELAPLELPDAQGITERWARQVECLVASCPKLKHLKV